MAKERAPRRRRRWFLLALLVGAVTWFVRSRSAARLVEPDAPRAAPPPVPAVGTCQMPAAAVSRPHLAPSTAPGGPPSAVESPVAESAASDAAHAASDP